MQALNFSASMKKTRHGHVDSLTPALARAEAERSLGFAGVSLVPGSWRYPTPKE